MGKALLCCCVVLPKKLTGVVVVVVVVSFFMLPNVVAELLLPNSEGLFVVSVVWLDEPKPAKEEGCVVAGVVVLPKEKADKVVVVGAAAAFELEFEPKEKAELVVVVVGADGWPKMLLLDGVGAVAPNPVVELVAVEPKPLLLLLLLAKAPNVDA